MRAGWHCNPGAAYGALGLSEEKIAEQIRNHKCFSGTCIHQSALTVVNGVMAGAVRISLGFMTTYEDCDRVVAFFKSYAECSVCNKHDNGELPSRECPRNAASCLAPSRSSSSSVPRAVSPRTPTRRSS